ncbi:MAG TPA: DUF4126 domain-containing protein [Syntrophales bacterium]|nr:DUF4126 domain-containing protein [Syntrophales bacterium]HRT62329.1 DUF4126 domain-containing protein [Syntrophales bacterium]
MNPYSDLLLSVCLGIGLSAACGFRVFIPLLVLSGASLIGSVHLVPELAWMGTPAAFWTFATAAVFEVAAYYIPWVDHLMDTIAGPAAAVAGALVMASSLTDMGPLLKWTLAVIAGTGSAALVQGSTMLARGLSTTLTGGMGNPAVSTGEAVGAVVLSLLAIVLPVMAALAAVGLILFMIRKACRVRKAGKTGKPA